MFEKKVWNDRQSEHPARRRLTPTENDNEYEVSRAEGLVMEEGDAFDATTMNDLENRVAKAFAEYDPAELGAVNVTVQLYTCKKEGKVYQLTGSGAVGRCKIPAAWASGDTWTVNGTTVPAYCGADAVDGDTIVAGRWAIFTFDIEVFGGAGWVLFGREPSSKVMEVFNDYDAELVNIYRCIKYHPDALQHELDMLPDAREVFFDCRAQEQVRGLTDIQRAARSLYLIKASFGTDRRTFATAPKGVRNISASFPAVQERLRRVIIENLDFEHLIKTYDRENALFYCDPPYVETEKYYRARFQESDHKRLADALHNIKGRFLLSYNDCPQVRELYADCIIEPVSRRNTLSAQSVDGYKEVLVRNYEL